MRVRGLGILKLKVNHCTLCGIGSEAVVIGRHEIAWKSTDINMTLYPKEGIGIETLELLKKEAKYFYSEGDFHPINPKTPSSILLSASVLTTDQPHLNCLFRFRGRVNDLEGCLQAAGIILSRAYKKISFHSNSAGRE